MNPAKTMHDLVMLDHTEQKLAMGRKHLDQYRRQGLQMDPAKQREEEMRIISSGDVHVSQPGQASQPQQPQSSGLGKVLAGAALGASLLGVPGAGVAGYLLSQINQRKPVEAAPVVPPSSPAETVDLGLKKIEDLEL
jgi:hypothetical protein